MTKSLLSGRARSVAGVAVGTLALASFALPAGTAFAAAGTPTVTAVTANATTVNVSAAAGTAQVTATTTPAGASTSNFFYVITSGPDGDKAGNGANLADGSCGVPSASGVVTCNITGLNGTTGTDKVTIFTINDDSTALTASVTSGAAVKTAEISVVKSGVSATVVLTPAAISVQTGAAVTYTVKNADASGNAVPTSVLNVEVTTNATAPSHPITVGGADVTTGPTNTGVAGSWKSTARVTTNASGVATFTVASSAVGNLLVRVFDGAGAYPVTFTGSQNNDTSSQTVAVGGDDVASITPLTAPDTQYTSVAQSLTFTFKNAAGTPVVGVTPGVSLTGSNAAAAISCSVTNIDGETTCSYTGTVAGTDTVTVWANKSTGAGSQLETNEIRATAVRKYTAPVTVDVAQSRLACTQQLVAGDNQGKLLDGGPCTVPADAKEVVLRATAKTAAGAAVSGAIVTFSVTAGTALVAGDSLPSCTTKVDGTCTTTLKIAAPAAGNRTITASVGAQTITQTVVITWATRAFAGITVSPTAQAVKIGSTGNKLTAKVVDQFGAGMAGRAVNFTTAALGGIGPRNTPGTVAGPATAADGTSVYTFSDTGLAGSPTQENIVATDVASSTSASSATYYRADITAASITLDATNACGGTADQTTAQTLAGAGQILCARVKDASGAALPGKTVTFTVAGTGGVLSAASATTNGTGDAVITLTSTRSGAKAVTATVDGRSDTANVTFAGSTTARNIKPTPASDAATALEAGGLKVLRFLVTDGYGNPVPNTFVDFNNAGAGFFFGGTNSNLGVVTNADGIASVTVTSLASTFGAANVTASIATTQTLGVLRACDPTDAVGVDAGAAGFPVATFTAGNCSTTAVVSIGKTPTISGTSVRTGAGTITVRGVTNGGSSVALLEWKSTKYVQVATTTASASGAYSFSRTISKSTTYRVKSPTVGGLTSAKKVVTVKFGISALTSSRSGAKATVRATINPKVGSVEVRFYSVSKSGKRTYLGKDNTNSNGTAVRTFTVKSGSKIAVRAIGEAGRATSAYKSKTV